MITNDRQYSWDYNDATEIGQLSVLGTVLPLTIPSNKFERMKNLDRRVYINSTIRAAKKLVAKEAKNEV